MRLTVQVGFARPLHALMEPLWTRRFHQTHQTPSRTSSSGPTLLEAVRRPYYSFVQTAKTARNNGSDTHRVAAPPIHLMIMDMLLTPHAHVHACVGGNAKATKILLIITLFYQTTKPTTRTATTHNFTGQPGHSCAKVYADATRIVLTRRKQLI